MTPHPPPPRPPLKPWPLILLWLVLAALAGGAVTSLVFTGVMGVVDSPGMTSAYAPFWSSPSPSPSPRRSASSDW